MEELNEIIKILESEIPANPASEKNERLTKRVESDMAEYFKGLEMAMPWEAIEQLYYRLVRQE